MGYVPSAPSGENPEGEAAPQFLRPRGNLAGFRPRSAPALEPIEALKGRVDLVELVGRYVSLTKRSGEHWGCCPFHGERTASFKVNEQHQRFNCFGCGANGDALEFVGRIEGLDKVAAIRRLRELAGSPSSFPARPQPAPAPAGPDPRAERNRERALAAWNRAGKIEVGSQASKYLSRDRGLGRWPAAHLSWLESCPWGQGVAACILAPVVDVDDELQAIWRIKFAINGEVERRGLGPIGGCAARLFDAVDGQPLCITEGVEDALAAFEMTGHPAWAALTVANMRALRLPPDVRQVRILADADEVGRAAAHELARRLRAEGRQARVLLPRQAKDPNELLKSRGRWHDGGL
jgi:DNA primase